MKQEKLLNPDILRAVAALGHTQYLAIGDAGLPAPAGVEVIDVSVSRNVPGFLDVLKAVAGELVIEKYIRAREMDEKNPALLAQVHGVLAGIEEESISHEEFKEQCRQATVLIRTGECSSYANVILVGGVNF